MNKVCWRFIDEGNRPTFITNTENLLLKYRPDLIIEDILDVTQELPTVHSEHGCRFPEDIIQYIAISNFHTSNIPAQVFIIDDIITTGGHFNAIKD